MEKGGIRETSLTTFEPIDEYDPEDEWSTTSHGFQQRDSPTTIESMMEAAAARRRSIATQRSFSQIRTSGFFGLVRSNSTINTNKTNFTNNQNGKIIFFSFKVCFKFVLFL